MHYLQGSTHSVQAVLPLKQRRHDPPLASQQAANIAIYCVCWYSWPGCCYSYYTSELGVCLAAQMCYFLSRSKSACLWVRKSLGTKGIQSWILYWSEIKLVLNRRHRLCVTCESIAPAPCWRGIHLAPGNVPCIELYMCFSVWQNWWQDGSGRLIKSTLK